MGKIIYEQKIDTFTGGISNDLRTTDTRKSAITQHGDASTYPHKIIPYYKTEDMQGTSGNTQAEIDIVKFIYAADDFSGSDFQLYGLGVDPDNGTNRGAIYYVAPGADETTKWTVATNGVSANDNRSEDVFFSYKSFIYFWRTGNLVQWATDASAIVENYKAISWTTVAQPVLHSADDIAYFFTDNKVHKLDGTTWNEGAGDVTVGVLALQTNTDIVSAVEYGNYLAIGCVVNAGGNKPYSVVYLWDRDSSLVTISQTIELGRGKLKQLANLNNKLIAVIDYGSKNATSLGQGRFLIKQASGNSSVTLNEIISDGTGSLSANDDSPANRFQVKNNILYMPLTTSVKSEIRAGIWAIDEFGNYSLDTVEESLVASKRSFQDIIVFDNTWYIAHSGTSQLVSKSDNNSAYSATNPTIYESLVFNNGDSSKQKKLIGVTGTYEALPSAASVVFKYRINENIDGGSWITIYTDTTDSAISHSSVNIESSGATLPEYKEIQFRMESISGAIITGLNFKAEETDKKPY